MKLSEAINKYELDIHVMVFDKGRQLKHYEIYNDNAFEREVLKVKEIGKDVYITLK
jgi:hypothetical protein